MELLGFVIGGRRSFAYFTPTVVTEESIDDVSDITMHPVDDSSVITDHVINNPTSATMEVFFNEESLGGASPADIYRQIIDLKNTGEPFDVITGKRTLKDMLFRSIRYTANERNEYVLQLSIEFQQVIRVPLVEVKLSPKDQPSKTQNTGKQQAKTDKNNADAVQKEAEENSSGLYNLIFK